MPDVASSAFSTREWDPGNSDFPVLLEHYQIHGIIGEGGMGTVFKAYHLNLKRFVAIKTLRIDQRKTKELVGRFKQEMSLVGQMDHLNVVRATDAGERNGVFYLVMEYLSGADLSRLVAKKGRLDLAFACELVSQAALGLDYIHRKGLVHRDMKPSNLLLTTSGLVKILDLGLARLGFDEMDRHEHTPKGYAVGTYSYMAPEQAMVGRSVDGRADLYSLGCTLFKLLTGRAPYGGAEYDNAAKVMHAQCNVPISAADGFASIPDKLGDVISKLTAKDPAQRYATGNEVAEALAPFFATSAKDALQPHPLEQGREEIHETPVRPLTDPLPEELTRLTASVHETPRDTLSKPSASVKPETTPSRARLALLIGSAVFLVALVITYFAVAPFREPLGEKKDPEKKTDLVTGDKKTEPPEVKKLPELMEVVLPVASDAVRNIDTLKAKEWHDLLNEPKLPPMLIGLRKGDVNASARWFPTQARLVVNPTSLVLTQLGVTNKDFSLRTTMLQQNWHGQVGLYWGYRENNIALKKKKAGDTIASFQMLRLAERREQIKLGDTKTSVKKFFVERCKVELMFDHLGQITLKSHSNLEYCDLLNFANEQIFSMEVRGGELSNAVFGQTTLTKRLCANSINKKFQPFDYQGGFGIYSFDTNFTVRNASVMLLE